MHAYHEIACHARCIQRLRIQHQTLRAAYNCACASSSRRSLLLPISPERFKLGLHDNLASGHEELGRKFSRFGRDIHAWAAFRSPCVPIADGFSL